MESKSHVGRYTFIFSIMAIIWSGCGQSQKKGKEESLGIDTTTVVQEATRHIFQERSFAPTYYTSPLKIIDNGVIPRTVRFKINGKDTEFVDASELTEDILLNLKFPEPYVEIREFAEKEDGTVTIRIFFNTLRQEYKLLMAHDCEHCWSTEITEEKEF